MSKEDTKDLLKFLEPFSEEIRGLALWLREFVWDLYPDANELIYDNYNALAFGWSPSGNLGDAFCSVAVWNDKYVHFGFYWGSKIPDPKKILQGNGNQYRYIKVETKKDFPKAYIKKLLKDAYAYSLSKIELAASAPGRKKQIPMKGSTTTKSSLAVKKRPGLVLPKKKKQ